MKTRILKLLIIILAATPLARHACGEEGSLALDLKHLETQAVQRVTVTMDKQLLDFAARFLPKKDPDTQKVRALVKDLDAISVRNLEFNRDHVYSAADLEKVRHQLAGPGWSKMVEVRGDENVDFYVKKDGEKILGFTIISAEPKELTIVSIQGAIRPEQLADLEGFAGIPEGLFKSAKKNSGSSAATSQSKPSTKE